MIAKIKVNAHTQRTVPSPPRVTTYKVNFFMQEQNLLVCHKRIIDINFKSIGNIAESRQQEQPKIV